MESHLESALSESDAIKLVTAAPPRFRFSIRSIFVLMVVAAVLLGTLRIWPRTIGEMTPRWLESLLQSNGAGAISTSLISTVLLTIISVAMLLRLASFMVGDCLVGPTILISAMSCIPTFGVNCEAFMCLILYAMLCANLLSIGECRVRQMPLVCLLFEIACVISTAGFYLALVASRNVLFHMP